MKSLDTEYETVALNEPTPGVVVVTLNRPDRFASTSAKFNAAFVRIGLSAGDLGASWLLTRLIGPARASEICFTGRMVAAGEALAIGLVNRVSEPDRLLGDVLALAAAIVANSPGGVQLSKRALQANLEISSYAAALELENRGQALLTRTADMPEALAAVEARGALRVRTAPGRSRRGDPYYADPALVWSFLEAAHRVAGLRPPHGRHRED